MAKLGNSTKKNKGEDVFTGDIRTFHERLTFCYVQLLFHAVY